jgi:glycosyltransferase involved in cell wall biosynthesis
MKISVITATFNAVHTVADSLRSIAAQTHPDVEHLIIDGDSRDGTQAVVRANAQRLACFVSEPDQGIYDALNKGLRHATGEVVGFLHADDVYGSQEVLASVARAFADPAVQAIYGDLTYVDT